MRRGAVYAWGIRVMMSAGLAARSGLVNMAGMCTMRARSGARLAEHVAHRAQDRHGQNDAHEQSTDDAERRTAHGSSIARPRMALMQKRHPDRHPRNCSVSRRLQTEAVRRPRNPGLGQGVAPQACAAFAHAQTLRC